MAKLLNLSQLASELGLDRRKLSNRLADLEPAEAKTRRDGRVDRRWAMAAVFQHLCPPGMRLPTAAAVQAALEENYEPEHVNEGNAQLVRAVEAALLARARARREELRVGQTRGELIEMRALQDLVTGQIMSARAQLSNVHRTLQARHPELPQAVLGDVAELHREALEELGSSGPPPELLAQLRIQRDMQGK